MQILDSEVPLIENIKQSLACYWVLWVVLLLTTVLDSLTTIRFMYLEGIEFEANLVVRWLAEGLGIVQGVMVGKALQLIAAIGFSALSFAYSRAILILLISLNLLAVYHNIWY